MTLVSVLDYVFGQDQWFLDCLGFFDGLLDWFQLFRGVEISGGNTGLDAVLGSSELVAWS